jgi:hypothetical protein
VAKSVAVLKTEMRKNIADIEVAKEKWNTVQIRALFALWMSASQACMEVELYRIR